MNTLIINSSRQFSASEMTYIVSGGALNSTHSLTPDNLINRPDEFIIRPDELLICPDNLLNYAHVLLLGLLLKNYFGR